MVSTYQLRTDGNRAFDITDSISKAVTGAPVAKPTARMPGEAARWRWRAWARERWDGASRAPSRPAGGPRCSYA